MTLFYDDFSTYTVDSAPTITLGSELWGGLSDNRWIDHNYMVFNDSATTRTTQKITVSQSNIYCFSGGNRCRVAWVNDSDVWLKAADLGNTADARYMTCPAGATGVYYYWSNDSGADPQPSVKQVTAGHVPQWTTTGISYLVRDSSGTKYLSAELSTATNARRFLAFAEGEKTDAKVQTTISANELYSDAGGIAMSIAGVAVRASGAEADESGYVIIFRRGGTSGTGEIEIGKYVNGTFSTLTATAFAIAINTKYHLLLEAVGTTIRGKVWADGGSEPGTWTLSTTDTSLSAGACGLFYFNTESTSQKYSTSYIQEGTATYTVTYDGNTNDSGTVPTDSTDYEEGDTVTVLGNTGSLAKTGYTFSGWNTAANGTGTTYAPNATFLMGTADVTLYAVWGDGIPGVTTNAATGVNSRSAILQGSLDDLGAELSVSVYFEYGLTAAYGSTTDVLTLSATGSFSAKITDFDESTTYHFRAVASDGVTAYNGSDQSLTTTACPFQLTGTPSLESIYWSWKDLLSAEAYTTKSVILDIANNHGDDTFLALRNVDFWYKGSQLLFPGGAELNAYATSEYNQNYIAECAFWTGSLFADVTGSALGSEWLSASGSNSNQRLIAVFVLEQEFDEIRINNSHSYGLGTVRGANNVKIHISTDTVTDTTYNAAIPNSTLIYDSTFDEHVAADVEDEQTLVLIGSE